jgi:hypothetical protein
VVLSHGFGASSNFCVSTENLERKIKWTHLTVPICKFRFGTRALVTLTQCSSRGPDGIDTSVVV